MVDISGVVLASQTLSQEVRNASAVSFMKAGAPNGPEKHVGIGQLMLAVAPGNFLHDHSLAAAAIDAPHGVQQEDQKSPERNAVVTPFRELIITGRRLVAAGTNRRRTFARSHRDFDAFVIGTEAGVLINETPEMMAAV